MGRQKMGTMGSCNCRYLKSLGEQITLKLATNTFAMHVPITFHERLYFADFRSEHKKRMISSLAGRSQAVALRYQPCHEPISRL